VRIVLNRHYRKSEFTPGDLAGIFKQPVFATVSNDYQSFMQAVNKGKTIRSVREKSVINRDLKNVAALLTGLGDRALTGGKKKLGSIFARSS
jgi:Flp pilus assembly CpaE family ATPase